MHQKAVKPRPRPACAQTLQPKAIPQPPRSLRRLLFTHLSPSTGMLAKTNGPCETLETQQMKLPAAEVCLGPGRPGSSLGCPRPFPPPFGAIPREVPGTLLPMRTGEGGRIHTQNFRPRTASGTQQELDTPQCSLFSQFCVLSKTSQASLCPSAQHPLPLCFQDRKLYQKWGTGRVVHHPHCTDGKVEERGAAQGHRGIGSRS